MKEDQITFLSIPLRNFNSSRKYATGTKHPTKSCGDVTIVGQLDRIYEVKETKRYPYFRVRFEDGTEINTSAGSLRKQFIWNPYYKGTYGEGYIGIGTHKTIIKGTSTREYTLWERMLGRCYSKNKNKYTKSYDNVEVCERWKCFQNFCADLPRVPNYDKWLLGTNKYELDKDILSKKTKIYSLATCTFVTHKENTSSENRRTVLTGLIYVAKRLIDGYEEEFTNQTKFAKKYELTAANVSSFLRGNYKWSHVKGWVFRIKEDGYEAKSN